MTEQEQTFKVTDRRSSVQQENAEQEQSFKVTDRRSSVQEEQAEEPKQTADEPVSSQTQTERPVQDTETQTQTSQPTEAPPFPEANLLTLIFSLYTHAQICLGVLPDPLTQQPQKDLPQAKYNIDLLGVLQAKTTGNLTQEEEQTLESILYEARMAYVSANK